jgi:nucleoside-diphosphate-sugar epimerase
MRLLVTGASSFVGAHFCVRASARHEVLALHHSTPMRLNQMTPIKADLRTARDRARVKGEDFDVVVHLATKVKGSGAQQTNRALMDSVLGFGRPVIYASSTVVHWESASPYRESRREDERRLAESGLDWVTVRPSAPYGPRLINHQPRHKESFHTLAEWVQNSRLVPVIGNGCYRRQPIHVHDFADAMLAFLDRGLPGRAFDAGGSQALSFNEIIDTIAGAANRRVKKLHLPKALFVQMARMSGDFDPDLIRSVDEDEAADMYELSEATGVRLRPFSEGVQCLI